MQHILYNYDKKKVRIEYEEIDDGIYIHTVKSLKPKKGNGTLVMKSFMNDFASENIYLLADSSMGTPLHILEKWYQKLGFIFCGTQKITENYDYNFYKPKTVAYTTVLLINFFCWNTNSSSI